MADFAHGDLAAGEILARRHGPGIRGFFRKALRRGQGADDLLQETFLRLARNRAAYRPGAPFRPWLYTIAYNLLRDELRREAVSLAGRPEAAARALRPAPGPEAAAEIREARERVREALRRLPDEQRIVLVLKHFQGLASPEIAALLSLPVGTVWSRLSLALAALRRDLRPEEGEP